MEVPSFVWGVAGAVVSWPLVEFGTRPFRQFFDIRRQVARARVMYFNIAHRAAIYQDGRKEDRKLKPQDEERLQEAEGVFRGLAADMRGFVHGEAFACWLVKRCGYDADKIASALIALSNNYGTAGEAKAKSIREVDKLLGIRATEKTTE